jgi:predicted metalloprotease
VNRTTRRTPFLASLALVLAAACAGEADGQLLGTEPSEAPAPPQVSDDPGDVADDAVVDVTAYWRAAYPRLYGEPFQELAGFHPYGPTTELPPCGPAQLTYEEIADNAFYCPGSDIIAWDEAALLPYLNENFGSFTVGIVIAHEYGHAVQERVGIPDRTIDLELQADCYAGAWTAHVADGASDRFTRDDIDLDKTVAGMIAIRDLPGTATEDDAFAHGSGFDRVSAFQDGFEGGPQQCVEYADPGVDRRTVEIPFREGDINTGGNFPLDDSPELPDGEGLLTMLERDLNDFYGRVFQELGEQFVPVDDLVMVDPAVDAVDCGGGTLAGDELRRAAVYCVDENVIVLDRPNLVDVLNADIGDFAVGAEISRLWALAAQDQLGVGDGEDASLQADCLTGAWAAWTFPEGAEAGVNSGELSISAGDLDEGLIGFLANPVGSDGGSAFARADALRTGFFEGYDACERYGPLA